VLVNTKFATMIEPITPSKQVNTCLIDVLKHPISAKISRHYLSGESYIQMDFALFLENK